MTYTPTLDELREAYVRAKRKRDDWGIPYYGDDERHSAEFDRAILAVRRETWDEGAVDYPYENPYTEED